MKLPFLYSVEREYLVSVQKLWRAWTDAAELESWYHGTEHHSKKGATASDLKIGGLWSCGIEVPAHSFTAFFYGRYTKIDENELIEHTMHYTDSLEEFEDKDFTTPSHKIVIELQDRKACAWVKFSQYGQLPDGEEKEAKAGMNSYLDSLARFLAEA